jgi:glycosyltransferase involved in cell wall biosynthesis
MRIVIDLQGAQGASRERGIGRYSLALAQAMVRNRGEHEVLVVLNGMFPDSIELIRSAFDGILDQDNIRIWHANGPVNPLGTQNTWRRHSAELLREAFLSSLNPDIVHITSLFEGFGDDAVHSIGLSPATFPTAVTLYDLIPLVHSDHYLTPNPSYETFYREKLTYLNQADIYLAISQSSRQEVIDQIGASPEKVTNIGAATESIFRPINCSEIEKQTILNRFGLNRRFIMYSGATDERKNHLRLIKAFSLLPSLIRQKHQLAIVGHLPDENLEKFETYAKICGLKSAEVVITGRVTDEEMVRLYNLCTLFVFPSWHEGFGLPALEAMSCGAPVIAAKTSSMPEVIGREDALFNPFDERDIAKKITQVLSNENLLEELAQHGLKQSGKFSWDKSAKHALLAFEAWHCEQSNKNYAADNYDGDPSPPSWLVDKIANLDDAPLNEADWINTADAIAKNHPNSTTKQLLIDISELSQRDSKTGIQRVVRSILTELLTKPPAGFTVQPIYAVHDEPGYRYARRFTKTFLNLTDPDVLDELVEIGRGDVFLGLDLQHHIVLQQQPFYSQLKQIGAQVHFVVYDLLPVLHPDLFPEGTRSLHARWLEVLSQADGLVCISRSVADEMLDWLAIAGQPRLRPLKVGWFHLGADVAGSVPSMGMPSNASEVIQNLSKRPTFLSVGTIEPRKGQMQTLNAFEQLWNAGADINLVIVGKHGWNVSLLVEMLRIHPERNRRLFWLEGITDEYLEQVYTASSCLIAASEGEGFGLPLIEAAQHHKPMIARDIPVFREVAGKHALYFSGLEPGALAVAVKEWLRLDELNQTPSSADMPWLTWKQSAQTLLSIILRNNWYRHWISDDVKRFTGSDTRMRSVVGKRRGNCMQTTNKTGYLLFGPYIPLKSGQYSVVVRGSFGKCNAGASIDIVVNEATLTLAETILTEREQGDCLASMPISLVMPCIDFEVRVWVTEATDLEISLITISPERADHDSINAIPQITSPKNCSDRTVVLDTIEIIDSDRIASNDQISLANTTSTEVAAKSRILSVSNSRNQIKTKRKKKR